MFSHSHKFQQHYIKIRLAISPILEVYFTVIVDKDIPSTYVYDVTA